MFKRKVRIIAYLLFLNLVPFFSTNAASVDPFSKTARVVIDQGMIQGKQVADGVLSFKGIPYAAPPIGPLRWKAPQPPLSWNGVRTADKFGARPIQKSNLLYEFRSEEMSEDCLFLNVWTSALTSQERKPVYIFIHGGSFIHGDGSQPAYDGTAMARKGVVYVSINYRLGVFGFMSHPELSKETSYGGSGNYGLLDQLAAIKWVKENITAFGGDPNKITIGGESVGAQSVSAHMASPLSKGLFSGAIAESGSLIDVRPMVISLPKSEQMGLEISKLSKAASISNLRSIPAKRLLKLVEKENPRRFRPVVDGYFLTELPEETFKAGKQAKVPLIIGWNAQEVPAAALFRLRKINDKNYQSALKRIYGAQADDVLKLYPSGSNKEVRKASGELMSDRLINYSSWKLAELHSANPSNSVYRYLFAHPHPGLNQRTIREGNVLEVIVKKLINKIISGTSFHASEIEYALGNLEIQDNYAWSTEDYKVSDQMQSYFVNFIQTGNPNESTLQNNGLVKWPSYSASLGREFISIQSQSAILKDSENKRYELFEQLGKE